MTDELAAWLTQIWDEDQALAERLAEDQRSWTWTPDAAYPHYRGEVREIFLQACNTEDPQFIQYEAGEHIARHDPATVLARIAADREILALADEASGLDSQVDGEFRLGRRDLAVEPYVGDLILRQLAAPHADRPGYREEWKP